LLVLTPFRGMVGYAIATDLGFLAASAYTLRESEKLANRKISKLNAVSENATKLLVNKHEELVKVNHENETLKQELTQAHNEYNELATEFDGLKIELAESHHLNAVAAIETMRESLTEITDQVNRLIPYLAKKYPELNRNWNELVTEFKGESEKLLNEINFIESGREFTTDELVSIFLTMQHEILTRGNAIKIKFYKTLINHLEGRVFNSVSADEHSTEVEGLKAQIKRIKDYYDGNLRSVQKEFSQVADNVVIAYKTDFKGVIDDGLSQTREIEELQNQILNLRNRIKELSQPLRFPGLTEPSRVGNAIIDFYLKLGYILDAIDWETSETGYKLLFHTSRNGSKFISCDLLNDGDNPHKIKEVSASLNTPKFEVSDRASYFRLGIQTRHKSKATAEDIARLWVSAEKFPQLAKGWTRVRLTGGSESGKSPTAENIAVSILLARAGTAKLFNPQHNSSKNYWTIPVVGTSHNDSERAIAELAKKVDLRSSGGESRDSFEVWIFDEIDSTMSHTHNKKSAIGSNVNFIIKQASHQNLGAIFIGQNANVSEYPGMDRSDWNSAVNIHIGANAYDAISNSNRFTSDEEGKLKAIADKLTGYCQTKNDELGLEKINPNAYRFALVLEPSKAPYFVELPAFGRYTHDMIQPAETNDLKCSDCGSTSIKRNGKVGDKQRFKCSECGKNWSS